MQIKMFMLVIGRMIKLMAKEPTIMQMELNMKVSGLKTSNTE